MTAQTGYVADALVTELVRAAHERGVRAGLEAAARVAEESATEACRNIIDNIEEPIEPSPDVNEQLGLAVRWLTHAARAIRALDPATVKEIDDGRE